MPEPFGPSLGAKPIRLLHFADLHIGVENYGKLDPASGTSSRVRDFLDRLDEVVAYAAEGDADLVIFAGDAFKTRDPDPTQQREFARRIKQLADRAPTFLLVGNHDVPGMAQKATSVDIFRALDVPGVIVGHRDGSQIVQTKRGPLFLAWMPFPVRNRLLAQAESPFREEHRGASIEQLDARLQAIVADLLRALAEEARAHDVPRVLAGHFSVSGATFGSERSVMLGRDLVVPKSALADPVWDYVALGHIHKHQSLTADERGGSERPRVSPLLPPVVYSGSLERIDFGEEVEDKGFCWVEVARGSANWRFHKVNARRFLTIKADVREATDPTAAVLAAIARHEVRQAVVRLSVQMRAGQEAALREREVEAALSEAAYLAAIVRDVERDVRTPLGGASPEALTPAELLERYLRSKGKTEEQIGRLMEAAGTIFDQ